jgi:hypothetical protein
MDRMCAADGLGASLRKSEMMDLAFLDQPLDGAGDVLDRHLGVHPVLVEQIDAIGLEALEHAFGHVLDVLRPAVQPDQALSGLLVDVPAEFRGDDHLVADRRQGLADKLLIRERAIDLGGVEKRNAALGRRADHPDSFLPAGRRTVAVAQPHAAVPKGRHFQLAVSEVSLLHGALLVRQQSHFSGWRAAFRQTQM